MIISGNWQGTYYFQSNEPNNEKGVDFKMTLTEKDGEIIGRCMDLGEKGIPEPAKIEGFVENNMISFIKQHPTNWYVNEEGDLKNDTSRPHPEIQYQGELLDDEFKGTWELVINPMKYGDGYFEEYISGRWEMRKEQ